VIKTEPRRTGGDEERLETRSHLKLSWYSQQKKKRRQNTVRRHGRRGGGGFGWGGVRRKTEVNYFSLMKDESKAGKSVLFNKAHSRVVKGGST